MASYTPNCLRPYDVLTLITEPNNANLAQADLTGVHIRSDQEVSVFGGHTCTYRRMASWRVITSRV